MNDLYKGNWSWRRFIKFILPSMFSMLILGLYSFVDGLFVSRFVGGDALASVNIAMPLLSLLFGFAIMLAVGGSTLTAISMGETKMKQANGYFTLTMISITVISSLAAILALIFIDEIVVLLGSSAILAPYVRSYIYYILILIPLFLPKIGLEFFLRADGSPGKAFSITIVSGLANVVLDYLFIVVLDMGIAGAALGTTLAGTLGTLLSLMHFLGSKSQLKFSRVSFNGLFLKEAMINGSSEMVNELSAGVITFLFNWIIIRNMGEPGVAAVSALFLINFMFIGLLLGSSMGFAPIISFYHGAREGEKKNEIIRRSLILMVLMSLLLFFIFRSSGELIVRIFVKEGEDYGIILKQAIRFFSFAYLFNGFNIFTSNYFTALNMGKTSALIALFRSLIGIIAGLILLPPLFGEVGIWLAVPFGEAISFVLSLTLFVNNIRKDSASLSEGEKIILSA